MKGFKKKIRDNKYLNWLLVISNWLLQGIMGADRSEKIFKILISLVTSSIFYFMIFSNSSMSSLFIIIISLFSGHTVNWILNTNFYSLLVHRLLISKNTKSDLFEYLHQLQKRLDNKKWLLYAAAFGSICRGELKDSSDLDISLVRKPGFKNALSILFFSFIEKKRADFKKIPLELWISDSPQNSKKKFGNESNPIIICDTENNVNNYYTEKMTITESMILNNIE